MVALRLAGIAPTDTWVAAPAAVRMGSEALSLRDVSHKGFGPIPVLGTDA
jgi:hypothetical protein